MLLTSCDTAASSEGTWADWRERERERGGKATKASGLVRVGRSAMSSVSLSRFVRSHSRSRSLTHRLGGFQPLYRLLRGEEGLLDLGVLLPELVQRHPRALSSSTPFSTGQVCNNNSSSSSSPADSIAQVPARRGPAGERERLSSVDTTPREIRKRARGPSRPTARRKPGSRPWRPSGRGPRARRRRRRTRT